LIPARRRDAVASVAAAYGGNPAGAYSGYSFLMSGLTPGTYDIHVWTHSVSTDVWNLWPRSVTVVSAPEHVLETPTLNQAVAQPFTVSGYAIDAAGPTGTGVDAVHVWAYHNVGSGSAAYMIGASIYGDARPDVAAARGARYLHSGYHLSVSSQPPGLYLFVVASHSPATGVWTTRTQTAYVDIPTDAVAITRGGSGTGAVTATGLACPGGTLTQAVPCSGSYALSTIVTLTAVPDPGSTFAGWGGSCAGAVSGPCVVQLNGDRFVSATFTKTPDHIATTCYHTDVIGSVRAITDETGAVVSRHDYLPFGEDTQQLTGDTMRFAGKELDPESALQNF
jgi:hypothetical protein